MARTASKCIYDDETNPFPTGSCSLYDAEGYFEGEDSLELSTHTSVDREFADCYHLPSSPGDSMLTCDTPDSTQLTTSEHEPLHALERCRTYGNLFAYAHEGCIGFAGEVPPISVLPSFLHPSIPSYLRVPLTLLGEENIQVQTSSDIDTTDIDMRSCVPGCHSVGHKLTV
jgi:hypothetical protein